MLRKIHHDYEAKRKKKVANKTAGGIRKSMIVYSYAFNFQISAIFPIFAAMIFANRVNMKFLF
jgi:hypothetical protein